MGIVFEQPQPLDPITSIRAGAAGVIEKSLPTMASLYEAAINARRGGGGGGGGGGSSGGGIQVLPSSDGGALSQVESQANREQQAANINGEGSWGMAQQAQKFNLQNQQLDRERAIQAQSDAQAQQQGQPAQQQQPQPAPMFTPGDEKALADAQQDLSTLDEKEANSEISGQEAWPARQEVNAKIAGLQQKQQAAQQYQQQQAVKQRDEMEAHQHGSWMREQGVMQQHAPGSKLPSGEVVVSAFPDGSPSLIKHWDLQHHAWKYEQLKPPPTLRTPADVIQEKKFAHEEKMAGDKRDALALEAADKRMMKFREQAEKELKPGLGEDPPTPAMIEKRTEAIRDHFDRLHGKPGGSTTPSQEGPPVENADVKPVPAARKALDSTVSGFPKQGNKLDFSKATDKQLNELQAHLENPGKVGLTQEAADALKVKIQAAKATNPPPPPMAGANPMAASRPRKELPPEPYKPGVQVPLVPEMSIWDALRLLKLPNS